MLIYIELFILIFLLCLIIYKLFIFKRLKNNTYPKEAYILKNFYKVDIKKLDRKKLLNTLAVVSSLDIALIVSIVGVFKSGMIQITIAAVLVLPIIFISYYLLSIYYKRKIKKENSK